MAVVAERHVVGLVLHQQIGLSRRVRLVARKTTERRQDLALVRRVHDVGNGVIFDRVSEAKTQGQDHDLVLLVVVVRQLDCAVEDGEKMLVRNLLGSGIGAVALETERITLGAQKMIVISAVRRVASRASLDKGGLVMHRLLLQIVDVAVTSQANRDCVGLGQARLFARVRTVAVSAIAHRTRVRHFSGFDELGFVVVASNAQCLGVGLGEHNLTVFCRRMTGIAAIPLERDMLELCHQLGRIRLMRIVALEAVGGGEGLVVMGFLQVCILRIVAIKTERRCSLGQVELVFRGWRGTGFVGDVAGVASHVERGMTAAFRGHIQPGGMATAAEVFFRIAGDGLEELILIVTAMRIVARETVANRRGMDRALDVGRLLVSVAGNA